MRRWLAGGAVVAAVAAGAVAWFEPHKLFLDDTVEEAAPAGPQEVAAGSFRGLEHATAGRALVVASDGRRVLRFEGFETSNGPDLRVYLSAAPPDAPPGAFDDDFVDLGSLKGNVGNQNYDIPAGVDLGKHRTAVIWCKRFSVPFGAAPLAP